ncbi:HAAS signaling domain-containing protein [Kribbella sp. CA-293567]|uniref:HAAS signaling domain-containing protein n=1 Tax=Kribbella sp. CA-293567 TaxID=3002436 RepID=UPI0022DD977B|nr:hypothetical protein [Kribbella sp. CA-293567]WBQ05139.1 hypothetical protein OX958_34975 [Kribbella sp. CA-293567]
MNSTLTGPVATYLTQVRAELSDLPPGELAEVLDDVTGHLSEVSAEFDQEPTAEALQKRLGTPRQYADELRTAAGYPPPTASPKQKTGAEAALRWGIVAALVGPFFLIVGLVGGASETLFFGVIGLIALLGAATLGVRALHGNDPRIVLETKRGKQAAESIHGSIEQIPPNVRHELVTIGQPVWWAARGIVGGGAIFALFGASAVTVVGALAGAVVSVWIGRQTQQDRRWLWYVVPLNVVAAIIVPLWLAYSFVGGSAGPFTNYRSNPGASSSYYSNGLVLNGTPVDNIYPFDEQGRQVKVRLYDQDGEPLNLELRDCQALYGENNREGVSNFFPQPTISTSPEGYSDAENCKDTDKAPFLPPPAPATRPSYTPSAGTTPTPPVPSNPVPSTPAASIKPSTPPPATPPTPGGVTLTVPPTTIPTR